MSFMDEAIPRLSPDFAPPRVLGTAHLTHAAYHGEDHQALLTRIGRSWPANPFDAQEAARLYDTAIAAQIAFQRTEGLDLQDAALARSPLYRIGDGRLRVLALVAPGDLMTNTPLDFLTNHLDVRLDLLYLLPGHPLPPLIPDHDVAFFAAGEADPVTFAHLRRLYATWPRPALNDPRFLPMLERDTLSRSLAGIPGIRAPKAVAATRARLEAHMNVPVAGFELEFPCLIRPRASHAGIGLSRTENPRQLRDYLRTTFERHFFITAFEDYASPDGLYRKSRIAFIDRQPFLCHLAISSNWMVHYLNAGMTESADKRAEEADAMAGFATGFAKRHAHAFDALHDRLGFDFYSIDCAETKDGRLLVFEADSAAIIHLMDPPDLFAYKQRQMLTVFGAFENLLRVTASQGGSQRKPQNQAAGLR